MASQSDTGIPAPVLSDGEDMRLLADQAIAVDPSSLESSHDRKVLKAYTVFEDPRITVIPNFLSDSEMQHLLDLAAAYWVPSTVGSGVYKTNDESKDLQNKQSKTRTSYSCMLRSGQTETVQMIEQKLARLAGLEVKYLERLNMVRYAPGQLFNRHHDGRFRPKTVFIYLNDLPENDGGETFFPDLGLKFIPRKGAAVMWSNVISPGVEDNRTIHLGMPPRSSTKYGVNCFFNEKPLREWEAANSAKRGLSVALRRVDPAVLLQEDKTILRPGQLRAFALCEDPRVRVIPRIITDEEVQALLALTHPPADSEAIDPEIYASIEHCIAAAAGRPVEKMEPLKVGKCTPDMTPDGVDLSDQEYLKRFGTVAVFLFLNEMEAADLCFPRLGLEIASCTACAVVWSTTSPSFPGVLRHKAQPPRSGTRIAAMGVFRDVQVVRAVKDVEKKRKLISPQRRMERLFVEEFKKSFFSPNPWYESPELTFPGGNPQKIYNYWMTTRPTRDIERVCDGKDSCGCTWTQLDGRRGASFVSFNQEGQVVFVREVCEPQGLGAKFKDNTLKSLQQVTGVMNAIQGMFSALDRILVQEDPEDGPKPVNGLEAPRSGRAKDVVRYLWEEAQWDPVDPVEKIMSQFSEDAVYEDLTREDSSFVGWEAIKRYQEETKENTPDNMRFVLDEMTDGEKACTVIWHVEFNTRLSPRGVTYYELNDEGKVCYVRAAYDISF